MFEVRIWDIRTVQEVGAAPEWVGVHRMYEHEVYLVLVSFGPPTPSPHTGFNNLTAEANSLVC